MNIFQRHDLAHHLYAVMRGISWPTVKDEPNFVAQMIKDLPAEIMNGLNSILPGRNIAAGAAFIHQKH